MPPVDSGVDLTGAFGPVYIGFVVSCFLGGITCVQAYIYFPHPNDSLLAQFTAGTMLIMDLVSSGLVAQSIYHYLLPTFGSLASLGSVTPELSVECLLSTIITLMSQMFFVYQLRTVRKMGRKSWLNEILIVLITICAFLAFAGGLACVASMFVYHRGVLSNRNKKFAIFFGIAKGFGALADILATIALTMTLRSSKTGVKQTERMLKSLIQFVIQRGILVTLIQVLLLVTFYAFPTRLIWFAFHVNVTKLYANTFFAMLNGREQLRSDRMSTFKNTLSSSLHASQVQHKLFSDAGNAHAFNAPSSPGSQGQRKFLNPEDEEYSLTNINVQDHTNPDMPTVTKSVLIQDI